MTKLAIAAALLAACATPLYVDAGRNAFEAGDMTAIMSGCGSKAVVGHLFCRFAAGVPPTGELVIVVPPTACNAQSCAQVTIWAGDMHVVLERNIERGRTTLEVPWTKLLGEGPVNERQRGFWPVLVKWAWTDPASGETLQAAAIGEIRVRVHAADYTPLSYDPANATWLWTVGGVTFSATDKGRSAIKAEP